MKCKKCGKILKENEKFCTICGYYNVGVNDTSDSVEEDLMVDSSETNSTDINSIISINDGKKKKSFKIKNKKDTFNETSFSYENESFLEAYIGEDYKQIKKWPFNIWAFLLNWMYLLYRKLYITGIIGLLITGIFIVFVRKYLIVFSIIIMILLGFLFNYYYVFIAKRKVEKILKRMEGTDNFTLLTIMKEEGGVNVPMALAIYAAFLLVLFFSLVSFNLNGTHNVKYWKENSENKANCAYLIKVAYSDLKKQNIGEVKSAACKITKRTEKRYEVYIKALYENRNIYVYYANENNSLVYQDDTSELLNLELMQANTALTPEQSLRMTNLKNIELSYQNVFIKSKKENELINKKKNTSEKLNFIFDEEEIIR